MTTWTNEPAADPSTSYADEPAVDPTSPFADAPASDPSTTWADAPSPDPTTTVVREAPDVRNAWETQSLFLKTTDQWTDKDTNEMLPTQLTTWT
jgi:hypothetical protein